MGTFTGVAYWTLSTNHPNWMAKALSALEPLDKMAEISYQPLPDRDELTITINGDSHSVIKMGGQGRGLVKPGPSAGAMIVCLLAINRKAGDLHLVDDLQSQITGVKQSQAFLGSDWMLTQQFAQAVELVPSQAFKQRHAKIFDRAF